MGKVPGPAHGIDRLAARRRDSRPVTAQQDCCCQVLLERRRDATGPIRTAMQTIARQIQTHSCTIVIQPHINAHVGLLELHGGSLAGALTQLIDNRVLGLERAECVCVMPLVATAKIHRERAGPARCGPSSGWSSRLHTAPRASARVESRQRHQNTTCRAGPQTRAIRSFQRAFELHAELEFRQSELRRIRAILQRSDRQHPADRKQRTASRARSAAVRKTAVTTMRCRQTAMARLRSN